MEYSSFAGAEYSRIERTILLGMREREKLCRHQQEQQQQLQEEGVEGCEGHNNDDNDDDDDDDDDPYIDISSMSAEGGRDNLRRRASLSSINSSGGGCDESQSFLDLNMQSYSPLSLGREAEGDGANNDYGGDDDDNNNNEGEIETSLARHTAFSNPSSTSIANRNVDIKDIKDSSIENNEDGCCNDDGDDDKTNNRDGNGDRRLHHHEIHNPQAPLKCVTDTISQHEDAVTPPPPYPSSPLGSGSAASNQNNNQYADNNGNGKTPSKIADLAMPRFYDSEDEGAGGSLVFVDSHSLMQMSPQACNQISNSDTINSNASGASMAERTSIRNLFIKNVERQGSSGSVVIMVPVAPSYSSEGDRTEEENDEDEEAGDDDDGGGDEYEITNEDFSPPHLMPYQQRKRLSIRGVGEEGRSQWQRQPAGVDVLPNDVVSPFADGATASRPFSPKTATFCAPSQDCVVVGVGGDFNMYSNNPPSPLPPMIMLNKETGGQQQHQQVFLPPPPLPPSPPPPPPSSSSQHQYQPPILASKYRVAPIPPFRGREASNASRNLERRHHPSPANINSSANENVTSLEGGDKKIMRIVKSAVASPSSSPISARRSPERKRKKQQRRVSAQQQLTSYNSDGNRPPRAPSQHPHSQQQQQQQHNFLPLATQHPPLSPRSGIGSGGYHIRINSQGSVSSLGSNAVGVDDAAAASAGENSKVHHIGMQPAMPYPDSREHWHYMQQQHHQQQRQQQQPNYNVNYNAILGREVAQFLHGEHIAKAAEQNQQLQQQRQFHEQQKQQWHSYNPFGPQAPPEGWNPHHRNIPPQWGQPNQQQQYGWYAGNHEHLNQHIRIFTPPTTWAANSKDVAHHHLLRHEPYLPSGSEDEGDSTMDPLTSKNKTAAGSRNDYSRNIGSQQQQIQMQWNQYGALPPSDLSRGMQQQVGNVHWNDPSSNDAARRRQQQQPGAHVEEILPSEKTSLLRGDCKYEEYDNNFGTWGRGGVMMPQHHGKPPQTPLLNKDTPPSNSIKKKKSKSRRHQKEKHRHFYPSESSDEEERSGNRHGRGSSSSGRLRGTKSKKKSKLPSSSRIQHRTRRSKKAGRDNGTPLSKIDDSLSETYSESDRSRMRHNKGFIQQMLTSSKLLVCNLPLSFSAISFSVVLLGIVWLKYAEENLPSCKEVSFHSSQCTFPEFPGCYFCDEYNPRYRLAIRFHKVCSYVAGASVLIFFFKATYFWRVFMDEMSSPTTASPSGLIFMTLAMSSVGQFGSVGGVLVFVASFLHLILVVWFTYMSLAYQTMPDPSWFANTVGIGLCAVKVWFYYPLAGHFLIAITLMLTFVYYPISLIRVALNEKMSATICWMNMMGPAVSLYSLAIIMEPTFSQERPDISHFQTVQRSIYLPIMTCLFGLCIIGMISSVHGLIVRWKQIAREEFSPAHAAYSFPLLMHAMAVQSYRSSLDFFAPAEAVSVQLKSALHAYWMVLLVVGTITALACIALYMALLLTWVDVDTRNELEPPAPNETSICSSVTYGESLIQPYVSPTILQANETGTLVMAYDYQNGWCDLVRTRRIPAFGFEPMMGERMFRRERKALKIFMGSQDVIQEGEEEGDEICFDNDLENASIGV